MKPTEADLKPLATALKVHHKINHVTNGEIYLLKHVVRRLYDKGMTEFDIIESVKSAIRRQRNETRL